MVLDTTIKPEIFKFIQHLVFSLQLGFKSELFLILFEQGSWLLKAWPGQLWPLSPFTQAKQKTRKHPNINWTAHMQPCAKYRGREPQWCLPSRVWRFLSICFSKKKKTRIWYILWKGFRLMTLFHFKNLELSSENKTTQLSVTKSFHIPIWNIQGFMVLFQFSLLLL